MRSVSYVQRVALEFSGSLFPHAICLGDADNDTVSACALQTSRSRTRGGARGGEMAGACVLRGVDGVPRWCWRCGLRAGARALGEMGLGRGRVGSYGALRPVGVGPEPWSGVFLGLT